MKINVVETGCLILAWVRGEILIFTMQLSTGTNENRSLVLQHKHC